MTVIDPPRLQHDQEDVGHGTASPNATASDIDAFYEPGVALRGAIIHVNVSVERKLDEAVVRRDLEHGTYDEIDKWLLASFYDETHPLSFVQMIAAGDTTWEALGDRLRYHLDQDNPNVTWIDDYV